jgi:hypothetical protein
VLAACDAAGSVPMMQEATVLLDPGPACVGWASDVPTAVLLRGDWLFRGWASPGANPTVERITIHRRVAGVWTETQTLKPPAGSVVAGPMRFAAAMAANADGSILVVADAPRRRLLTATRDANGSYAWQPSQQIDSANGRQDPLFQNVRQGLRFDGTTLVLHTQYAGHRLRRRPLHRARPLPERRLHRPAAEGLQRRPVLHRRPMRQPDRSLRLGEGAELQGLIRTQQQPVRQLR